MTVFGDRAFRVDLNPICLVPWKGEKVWAHRDHQEHVYTEQSRCEDRARRQPPASKGQRPRGNTNPPGLPPTELRTNKFRPREPAQPVAFCMAAFATNSPSVIDHIITCFISSVFHLNGSPRGQRMNVSYFHKPRIVPVLEYTLSKHTLNDE